MAIIIVFLMLASSLLAMVQTVQDGDGLARHALVQGGGLGMSPFSPPTRVARANGTAPTMPVSTSLMKPCWT